jgi:hypothetical protein
MLGALGAAQFVLIGTSHGVEGRGELRPVVSPGVFELYGRSELLLGRLSAEFEDSLYALHNYLQ